MFLYSHHKGNYFDCIYPTVNKKLKVDTNVLKNANPKDPKDKAPSQLQDLISDENLLKWSQEIDRDVRFQQNEGQFRLLVIIFL